jgi:hypothetical protein
MSAICLRVSVVKIVAEAIVLKNIAKYSKNVNDFHKKKRPGQE